MGAQVADRLVAIVVERVAQKKDVPGIGLEEVAHRRLAAGAGLVHGHAGAAGDVIVVDQHFDRGPADRQLIPGFDLDNPLFRDLELPRLQAILAVPHMGNLCGRRAALHVPSGFHHDLDRTILPLDKGLKGFFIFLQRKPVGHHMIPFQDSLPKETNDIL